MVMVFNLSTGEKNFYMDNISPGQALKTQYAIDNNLATRLASDFDNLMNELQGKVEIGKNTLLLENLSVFKNK